MRKRYFEKNSIIELLKLVAPGSILREGLDNIVRAGTGALIVASDSEDVMKLVDGGFNIDKEMLPATIYELAKMDGGIVLSEDLKKILYANAQLVPDSNIASKETGTRHRTAERVAKQTGRLVISISQRRSVITLYRGNCKYLLKDTSEILNKANQALQTLEKYKNVLERRINRLTTLEFRNTVTVFEVAKAIQRSEMFLRIINEIEIYILELGDEGRLIEMQLEELRDDFEKEIENIYRDYYANKRLGVKIDINKVQSKIENLTSDELVDLEIIAKLLGYGDKIEISERFVSSRGYRILNRIPKIPFSIIENTIEKFGELKKIIKATVEDLDTVEGIGEIRAKQIKEGLRKIEANTSSGFWV